MPTFNILSIDGGGLRGIVPLRILQKVEARTGKRISETFDMISGTSTGGLLACCLTLSKGGNPPEPRYTLEDIAGIYIKDGHIIFPIRSGIVKFWYSIKSYFAPAYTADGIDEVLRKYAGTEKTIKDALRPVLVSTYDLHGNHPVFFKTSEANDDASANARIFDVCRATSAAPTYLPAYGFIHKGKKLLGIDGGVYVNNPTMAALAEISRYGMKGFYKKKDGSPVAFDDVRVLSLGTGSYTGRVTSKDAVEWGKLDWVTQIIDIMMTGVNQTTSYESSEMLDKGKYFRANIDIQDKQYSEMDDARLQTRDYLEREIKNQLTENDAVLKQLYAFIDSIS